MSLKHIVLNIICLVTVAACTSVIKKDGQPQPSLTFENYQPIDLNVDTYSVITNYEASRETNDRSSYFPVTPLNGIEMYLNKRFRASEVSAGEHFYVTILDASLPYKLINSENMFLSALDLNQKEEYTINYVLKLEKLNEDGVSQISTVMRYKKSEQFDRSLSLSELEQAYLTFLEGAIAELDDAIIKSMTQNFRVIDADNSDQAPAYMNYDPEDPVSVLDPSYPNQKPTPLNRNGVTYNPPAE